MAVRPRCSCLVPFALLVAGRIRLFAGWAALSLGLAGLTVLALGQQGIQDWLHAIAIAQNLPGIRINSVGSVIGAGVLAAAVSVAAADIAIVIGRLSTRGGAGLPIAAGLSRSGLPSPSLSLTT